MSSIVFVTGSMSRGGAERVISILSNYYMKKGYTVRIIMLLHNKVEYDLDDRIEIIDMSRYSQNIFSIPMLIYKVRQYIKVHKPMTVVGFMAQICAVLGVACLGIDTRLILSERIDPSAVRRNVFLRVLLNFLYGHCDRTVLQTNRAREYFPKRVKDNCVIIPNPINVSQCAKEEKKNKIVTAGRLTKQKNHRMLIKAFECIVKEFPEYHLDIYGEGPLHSELQQLIDEKDLNNAISLRGNVKDIHDQIADAEIFVLSSDFEGLSNALLEAMMMGLPCIATNCSGCDEVIDNNVNGILIDIGAEDQLIIAMKKLISNKEFAKEIGKEASKSVFPYYVENVICQWNEVIEVKNN